MSINKAFIDNNQIKIIDSDGKDYFVSIAKQEKIVSFLNNATKFSIIALISFILIAFSPLFFEFFYGWQIFFFVLCSIVCAFLTGSFVCQVQMNENELNSLISSYNLAKEQLQPNIMRLQKELIKHNMEIQQIENQYKFNFKKQGIQEMTI